MRILITGHDGYIGAVLARVVREAGHDVVGLDTSYFEGCALGPEPEFVPRRRLDVRDVQPEHVRGVDAVVHLAGLSNDSLGLLDRSLTYDINHRASVALAEAARFVGVERFVFASSCSLYGTASTDGVLPETAPLDPITAYGESKALAERDISRLADDRFSPTFLRNATVYGPSPRLRLDLVVNDLVANALLAHEITLKSDGTSWRPLLHIDDAAAAVVAAIEAPRGTVHDQAFNIGATAENFRVRDIAEIVAEEVPGSAVRYSASAGSDPRSYRVDFSKADESLPGFRIRWTVRDGVRQLVEVYRRFAISGHDLGSSRFFRLRRIEELLRRGTLRSDLRWAAERRRAI